MPLGSSGGEVHSGRRMLPFGPPRRVLVAMALGAAAWACANTDPVLEKNRELEALRAAHGACFGDAYESCYTGPPATEGRGACRSGQHQCQGGMWGPCIGDQTPVDERCNGIDDDCDGIVDNGFERSGGLCYAPNAQGACRSQGRWACSEDGTSSGCDAPVIEPTPERCDGIDNDCDGEIDEDAIPAAEMACSTGRVGICAGGTRRCLHATVRCVQDVPAGIEVCNGLDDDCDGEIDDQCVSPRDAAATAEP